MKIKPTFLVLGFLALSYPALVSGATVDPYAIYQKFVSSEGASDEISSVSVVTEAAESRSGTRVAGVLVATSTSVGEDVDCSVALGIAAEAGDTDAGTSFDIACRTVEGREYVRLDGGWISINGNRGSLAETAAGSKLIGKWFSGSVDGVSSDGDDAASAASLLLEEENFLESLSRKDGVFSMKTSGNQTSVTVKISPKAKVTRSNPELKGATLTITGDPSTGKVSKVELAWSSKEKTLRLNVRATMTNLGNVPSGTVISMPSGKVGAAEEFESLLEEALDEATAAVLPTYESDEDLFSVKFSGKPEVDAGRNKENGNNYRSYTVEGDNWSEAVYVTLPKKGFEFNTDDASNQVAFEGRLKEFRSWWGKKTVLDVQEIDMEGYTGQRAVMFVRKNKQYSARVYFCTETQCFDIIAADATRDEAESRLNRLVDTLNFWY